MTDPTPTQDTITARLEEVLAKATPGPWDAGRVQRAGVCTQDGFHPERKTPYDIGGITIRPLGTSKTVCSLTWSEPEAVERESTAALIVEAINALPALLSERATLKAELEEARGVYEAAAGIIARMASTYRARNGREIGIQGDDGEKCWIVHSDDITALEGALDNSRAYLTKEPTNGK